MSILLYKFNKLMKIKYIFLAFLEKFKEWMGGKVIMQLKEKIKKKYFNIIYYN